MHARELAQKCPSNRIITALSLEQVHFCALGM